MVNLDTHILLAAISGRAREQELAALDDFWCISDMVLWELGWLAREGRIELALNDPRLHEVLARTTVWPITPEIADALKKLDFRSDPVDEIIGATSLVHNVPLLTRDARMLASKVVPLALR